MTGIELVGLAVDRGWVLREIRRLHGVSLSVIDPETGLSANAFGYSEEAAWEHMAEQITENREFDPETDKVLKREPKT